MTVNQKRKKTNVGISITRHTLEAAVFSEKTKGVEFVASMPAPAGMFDVGGDQVLDPALLKQTVAELVRQLPVKPKFVNLSLPGSLLRMVPMPRLEPEELYVSLSAEAERYKAFDGTEAVVDFSIMDLPPAGMPPNMVNVLFGAIRKDSLDAYVRALQGSKLKVAAIELEPLNTLRGMAATGVLDALVHQIGDNAHWGVIFVEPERVRISLWQGSQLLEFRETNMNTIEFESATPDSIVTEDIVEEIRRSTKMFQPSIWLTHNMPHPMEQNLAGRLGVPVRACPVGDGIPLSTPSVMLSSIGASVSSSLVFPVPFDILAGMGRAGGGSAGVAPEIPDVQDDSPLPALAIGLGTIALVLSALTWLGLYLANSVWVSPNLASAKNKQTELQSQMASLGQEKKRKEEEASARQALVSIIADAKIRNRVYVDLTQDLRHKTPQRLWIQQVDADGDISFQGRAMDDQQIINFAKSFDNVPYIGQVLIDSIQEQLLQGVPVFLYKIKGNVKLDKALISDEEAVDAANAAAAGTAAPPPEPATKPATEAHGKP